MDNRKNYNTQKKWCPGRDLNPHGLLHTPLKRTCLPVPPPGRGFGRDYLISLELMLKMVAGEGFEPPTQRV